MPDKFLHEQLYRGGDALRRLAGVRVALCGAGALGSHLADTLSRQGVTMLRIIDRDRVEEHNVGTQVYGLADVRAWKADALRGRLFRGVGVEIEAVNKELTAGTAGKLLRGAAVIVDTFDNAAGRRVVQEHCRAQNVPCLHAGLYEDYGEVIWDERYHVPPDAQGDVCEYPLARNLILLVVAVAAETLVDFALTGRRRSWTVTLRDLAVRPLE